MKLIMKFKSETHCREFRQIVAEHCPDISYNGQGNYKGEYTMNVSGTAEVVCDMWYWFGRYKFYPSWYEVTEQ